MSILGVAGLVLAFVVWWTVFAVACLDLMYRRGWIGPRRGRAGAPPGEPRRHER